MLSRQYDPYRSDHERGGQPMEEAAIRQALVRQFEGGRDLDETHEMYHDDAVLEVPQSGERFIGVED